MYPMQVTITISTEEQFLALARIVAGSAPPVPAKAAKGENKEPGLQAPPDETTEAPPAAPTMKDAQDLTLKILQGKGRDAAVTLLQKYGVAQAVKLQPGQIAGFVADAQAVLNG